MSTSQSNCRLYVGNIDFRISPNGVRDLFSEVGDVVDVYFPRDPDDMRKPHRGYVFVEMGSPGEAMKAIEEFHGSEDEFGRELIVRVADIRRPQGE